MVSVASIAPPLPIGEQRVVFRNITWQGYQQILDILGNKRAARLTFDRGTLEITKPLQEHEFARCLIERFIRLLVVELGLKIKTMGSTTLDRSDLNRGAEPDNAYYIQNQPIVAGRTVDIETDPPPDLVVEVDITHTDIDKPALYASMGVPEFWRYNGREWRIYTLENGKYLEVPASPTFPIVPKEKLYEFLAAAQVDEIEAEDNLRNWVREMKQSN